MKKILTPSLLLLFFYSCSSEAKKENQEEKTAKTEESAPEKEKWKINDTLLTYVHKMENTVKSFAGTELEEFHQLSDTLSAQINEMINSCRMKGPSHDELHHWLLPFIKLKKQLKQSEVVDQAKELKDKMTVAFTDFWERFE